MKCKFSYFSTANLQNAHNLNASSLFQVFHRSSMLGKQNSLARHLLPPPAIITPR
jgi:hypothetical protein